ncbi:MAG TPA: serine hydrolase, partial [Caldilineaceae bacterium]|nr:serine hydrolase [Caldilineaceae bacterium]
VDTRFAMASVTKSFTAMSVALLVDEGKLAWDKPVRDYIPEFILDDPYVTEHITVRDMLSHRTGLPRHDFAAWRLDISRAEFVKRMRHLKFSASFREKFQYNNLMYYATGYLVETVAEQPWETFMQERIFDPLGMTASNFVPEPPQATQVNAEGYRVDRGENGEAKGLVHMPYAAFTTLSPGAAGALFSTLADLTQWLKVHVNSGRAGAVQLVSPENLKQMHLPQTIIPGGGVQEALMGNTIFAYGMGWFIEPYRGYTLIHHGGNLEGHSLIVGFVPQAQIGVVGLTNIAGMPLRDVLLYDAIDRALDLPEGEWNRKYHDLFDPIIAGQAQGKATASAERIPDAPPTHPLATYAGTFAADGYPDFAVKLADEALQACTVGSLEWSTLRHYHYNVFEWHLADFDNWMKIQFLINENGEIDAVSLPIEPAVDNIIFRRKTPTLPADLVTALCGQYEPPVAGMMVTISAQADKFYYTQTGGAAQEIKPYLFNDEMVGFRLDRVRLDFTREGDTITRLTLKMPGMTLEAPRTA